MYVLLFHLVNYKSAISFIARFRDGATVEQQVVADNASSSGN